MANCTTAAEAAQTLNREFFNLVNVHYNTKRRATNQSPSESIEQGMATCTGLSILLVDACRSVGVPARAAGVANWHDQRGNHTWVEIHDGQRWRFLGADEYDAKGLDRGWFTGAASKAIAGDPVFGVWATSWKPVDGHFTMAWNPESRASAKTSPRGTPPFKRTPPRDPLCRFGANQPAANAWHFPSRWPMPSSTTAASAPARDGPT